MKSYVVYQLVAAEDVRYVGVTSGSVKDRLRGHRKDRKNRHKWNWFNKCDRAGVTVTAEILDTELSLEDAYFLEKHYIRRYRREGKKLLNTTEGGDGVLLLSVEAKERQIAGLRRHHEKMRTEKMREEMRQRMLTREWTPARRAAQKAILKRATQTEAWRKNSGAAVAKRNKANWRNPVWAAEMRKKIAASNSRRAGKPRGKRYSRYVQGVKP